jgi:hypothetical protein
MARRALDLVFPVGGVDERASYQNQRPYTTPDAMNCRGKDTFERRERGGSRPGLQQAYGEELGSGNPVRMLGQVRTIAATNSASWWDEFVRPPGLAGGYITDNWIKPLWAANLPFWAPDDYPGSPSWAGDATLPPTTTARNNSALVNTLVNFDATQYYRISLDWISKTNGSSVYIYLLVDRLATGFWWQNTGGIRIEGLVDTSGVRYYAIIGVNASGTVVYNSSYQLLAGNPSVGNNAITAIWTPGTTGTLNLYWGGQLQETAIFTAAELGVLGAVGSDIGWGVGLSAHATQGQTSWIDWFQVDYSQDVDAERQRVYAVASSNGEVWRDTNLGTMVNTNNALTISKTREISATDRLQKLYIADYGLEHSGTNGACTAASANVFTSAGATFASAPVSNKDDAILIIASGNNVTAGRYVISSVDSDTQITLATEPTSGGDASGVTYRIERTPKIYDPSTVDQTASLTAWTDVADSSIPIGCPLICTYLDRLVLAGSVTDPHLWQMSGIFAPNAWAHGDYPGDPQVGSATDAGAVGAPITALISHSDDFLIFGGNTTLWVLRGDPTYGGRLDNLSPSIGVVDANAWCRTSVGETVILSRDGVYMIEPGGVSKPISISRERIPAQLLALNPETHIITMAYDVKERGVHIYVVSKETGGTIHWWLDWENKSFWPVELNAEHEPYRVLNYQADSAGASGVLLGCRDGYIRKYNLPNHADDGIDFTSYVYIGPIRLGGDGYYEGIVNELIATVAKSSGDVNWSLHVGETAEAARNAAAFDSGTWTAGMNTTVRPRARAAAFFVKLTQGEDNEAWSMERLTAVVSRVGRQRL